MLTVAVAMAGWLTLSALAAPFVDSNDSRGSGITIRNGSQSNAPLPLRYALRIEAIPGARQVTWFTFQIVNCRQAPTVSVTLSAYGGPGAVAQMSSAGIDPTVLEKWKLDPLGALISDKSAADCGWRVDQGVEPPDVIGMKQLPLHISGIYRDQKGTVAVAHFDYINRMDPMFGKDKVLYFLVNSDSAESDELLAARIEAAFAHDFPTVVATTNATVQNAWARFGKVQQLFALVMLAILLCAASVLISVMAHTSAQRRTKFALLRVLGFRRRILFFATTLELAIVIMIGTTLGVGLGWLMARFLASTTVGLIAGDLAVPAWAYVWLPFLVTALLVSSLVWPASLILRVRPVDYRAI